MPMNQLNQVTKEKLYKRASSFHILKPLISIKTNSNNGGRRRFTSHKSPTQVQADNARGILFYLKYLSSVYFFFRYLS